ncbi:hypothetical protein BDZ91DRAFT_726203 [Kalaharituber pfeilii]|nr:hypothetical protein BDZ91DRAFT_726203 [Kalaharituber pfeilii]
MLLTFSYILAVTLMARVFRAGPIFFFEWFYVVLVCRSCVLDVCILRYVNLYMYRNIMHVSHTRIPTTFFSLPPNRSGSTHGSTYCGFRFRGSVGRMYDRAWNCDG